MIAIATATSTRRKVKYEDESGSHEIDNFEEQETDAFEDESDSFDDDDDPENSE